MKDSGKDKHPALQPVTLEGLLIESDELLADIIGDQLSQYKVDLNRANSPEEVFIFLEGKKLDAVLIDLGHPSLDPFQMIAAIRRSSSNSNVPIIALVSLDDITLLERASRVGASHFLPKPLIWSQMHQLMESLKWRMVDDKRHYRRAMAIMPVLLSFKGQKIKGQSIDISSTGILMQVNEYLPVGTVVTAAFPHSDQCPAAFLLQARVARLIEGKEGQKLTGLTFTDISNELADKLVMWVDLFLYFDEGVVDTPK